MKEYKHVIFDFLKLDRDINKLVYICAGKTETGIGFDLGLVCWYEPWNQYVYQDTSHGFYSESCLIDIADFVSKINSKMKK
ncbi:MAG TPA: hypothetical protein DC057_02385 [Spirochaetia bacterium]|nr:hypothetical protein [Spirochaetia bacterium]